MKLAISVGSAMLLAGSIQLQARAQSPLASEPRPQPTAQPRASSAAQQRLAPGLAALTDDVLFGDVWRRPELSPRDRSLVTISVLIATGKLAQLEGHLGRALTNGVLPIEASAVLAHLAIYSGWPNAVSALEVYEKVYTARNVDTAALRAVSASLPTPASDASRARMVNEQFATVAPKFAQLTNEVVFGDLWRRADLSVRDRSRVTIVALAGMGDDVQLDFYLRRGVESGLTREQMTEALTHLAFYAGWPRASKAIAASERTFGQASEPGALPAPRASNPPAEPPQPSANFTGSVSVTGPFRGLAGSRLGGATVAFQPAARTHWHIHPFGQLLIVTAGRGWMQIDGEPVRAIAPGDVVWTPPGTKHWHGATPSTTMTHVAVSETQEGSAVTWLEPVTDAQFKGPR